MNTTTKPVVIAATDGSEGADKAVEWAVREAVHRQVPLRLVRCWNATPAKTSFDPAGTGHDEDERRLLDELERAAREIKLQHPDLDVRGELLDGPAADVLIDRSKQAAMIVLGTRDLSAFGSIVIGSVGTAVAARAHCVAIVVRSPEPIGTEPKLIVAGVNVSQKPSPVLEYAFDYASKHGVPLRVVMCAHRDLETPPHGSYAHLVQQQLHPILEQTLVPWKEKYPDVEVASVVTVEHRVAGLVQESASADLLVVGSRGHHAALGSMLGSVSQGVLHHARCPVAVVPVHD